MACKSDVASNGPRLLFSSGFSALEQTKRDISHLNVATTTNWLTGLQSAVVDWFAVCVSGKQKRKSCVMLGRARQIFHSSWNEIDPDRFLTRFARNACEMPRVQGNGVTLTNCCELMALNNIDCIEESQAFVSKFTIRVHRLHSRHPCSHK